MSAQIQYELASFIKQHAIVVVSRPSRRQGVSNVNNIHQVPSKIFQFQGVVHCTQPREVHPLAKTQLLYQRKIFSISSATLPEAMYASQCYLLLANRTEARYYNLRSRYPWYTRRVLQRVTSLQSSGFSCLYVCISLKLTKLASGDVGRLHISYTPLSMKDCSSFAVAFAKPGSILHSATCFLVSSRCTRRIGCKAPFVNP